VTIPHDKQKQGGLDFSTMSLSQEIDSKRMADSRTVLVVLPISRLEITTSINQAKNLNIHLKEVCHSSGTQVEEGGDDKYQQIEISVVGPNSPQVIAFLKCLKAARSGGSKGGED